MKKSLKITGFTLIELMVTVGILGVLMAIALPSFTDYVVRGKLTDATENLSNIALQMEQFYQDNRTYRTAGAATCGIANYTTDYFSITCVSATLTTYTWTAASLANVGLGTVNGYQYTINQDNNRFTLAYDGTAYAPPGNADWQYKD